MIVVLLNIRLQNAFVANLRKSVYHFPTRKFKLIEIDYTI